jgi:NUDIX domain
MKPEILERQIAQLPYDVERRSALVVRLFRAPVLVASGEEMSEEACAGMIENEDADTTARREAYEELGVDLHLWNSSLACGRAQASQPNASRSSSHLIAPLIASATAEACKASMRESPLSSGCSQSSRPMSIKDGSPTESY